MTAFRGNTLVLVMFLREDLFDCYVGRLMLVKITLLLMPNIPSAKFRKKKCEKIFKSCCLTRCHYQELTL